MKLVRFFRSPQYALFALAIWLLSYLVISGSQSHNNFSYAILLLPTLLTLQFTEIANFIKNKLAAMFLMVIATLILGAAIKDGNVLNQLKFSFIVIVFFLAVSRLPLLNDDLVYKAAWAYLFSLIGYVIYNLVIQSYANTWHFGERFGLLSGKLENQIYVTNTMGCMLSIITLLGLRMNQYKLTAVAHSIVLFFCVLILQTRSILGIELCITIMAYLSLPRDSGTFKSIQRWIIALVLLLAFLIVVMLFYTHIGDNLLQRKVYRFEIWQGFLAETIRCGIFFGCGPEHQFRYISNDGMIMVHAHSIFVSQLYKAGLIGLVALVALSLIAVIDGVKAKSWAGWYFLTGIIGLCFDGSSLIHSPNQRWLVFHLPLALLISQQIHQKKINNIET